MPRKLKVFRTAIGFHDAYVAAPSRMAALEAWGTDKDLFARGVAEEVSDPALMSEALAEPGTVFRRLRDAPPEPVTAKRKAPARSGRAKSAERMPSPPPQPPPSRDELEAARRALEQGLERHKAEQDDLATRERALADERRSIEQRQEKEIRQLQSAAESAEQDYDARLKAWRKRTAK
jgi:hypothetical protein